MKNQKKLEEVSVRENKVYNRMMLWRSSFFPVSIVVISSVLASLYGYSSEFAGKMIFIMISSFAGVVIFGYIVDKFFFQRKLKKLWEEKKFLMRQR